MKKIFLFLLPALVVLTSCKDDSPLTITLEPSVIAAPSEGGVFYVTINATGTWEAIASDSWMRVTPTIGDPGITRAQIEIAAATDTANINGRILFTCGSSTAALDVSRSGLIEEKNYIKVDLTEINAPATGGYYLINIESDVQWQAASSVDWVTLHKTEGQNNDSIAVAVKPNNTSSEPQSGVITISEKDAPNNKVEITVTREGMVVKPAFKYASFSVDSDKKVLFSRGNLQYQASTNKWRFAEFQYDIIGEDNANISTTYSGWIDLFGWGTGSNPTLHVETSANYSSYYEWGSNSISNDDYDKPFYGEWKTLSKYEWEYLLFKRRNAASLLALGTANGVPGLIILPDDWQLPAGMTFLNWAEEGLRETSTYFLKWTSSDHPFDANTYTASEWAVMEKAGAVFLPAAGYRAGTDITLHEEEIGDQKLSVIFGGYWTSTKDSHPYSFIFQEVESFESLNIDRNVGFYGYSVRLVYKEIVIN